MKPSFRVVKLSENYQLKPFDCGNTDLNNFLTDDALYYKQRLLAVTYILENETDIIAYFSVSNDKISIPESDKAIWRKIKKRFPFSKHRSDYPAVKIGRLAIDRDYQRMHLGTDILWFIKEMFVKDNRTGCSFVTVDALQEAVPFYLKNGFEYMRKDDISDKKSNTLLLFFDLYPFSE